MSQKGCFEVSNCRTVFSCLASSLGIWYHSRMSNLCSKCGKRFTSSRSFQKVCPECLNAEFADAFQMEEAELAAIRERQAAAARRQHARMAKLLESYKNGTMFNITGKIMFCVGLFIVAFCNLIFFLDGRSFIYWGVDGMDMVGKQAISVSLSAVGALLLVFSTRRFKLVMLGFSVLIVLQGWYAPSLWTPSKGVSLYADKENALAENPEASVADSPVTEEELSVFYELKTKMPRCAHYAIFMDNQDPAVRSLVRDALTRLLDAEYTRAYTRTNGILYVVANASKSQQNVSSVVERIGTVIKSDVSQGLYLVRFDANKTNMVSQYSAEVLSSPMNAAFVTANISELQCLDSMRIRVAARSLKNANVQMLRGEIRDALVKTLKDSWTQDQDTYVALVDALVTYAPSKDKEAIAICEKYFSMRYESMRDVLPSVANYLINEQPEKMVEPVIAYWLSNSVVWSQSLRALSWRVQPKLLEIMQGKASIKDLNMILRYLQTNGNADAIPAVKKLMDHPDSIIRYSARNTLKTLEEKENQSELEGEPDGDEAANK